MECFIGSTKKKNDNYKLNGKLADVNLWSSALNTDALIGITKCNNKKEVPKPDLLDWNDMMPKNNISGCEAIFQNVTMAQLCKSADQVPELILFEHQIEAEKAFFLCNALGGEFFMPKNMAQFDQLANLISNSKKCGSR